MRGLRWGLAAVLLATLGGASTEGTVARKTAAATPPARISLRLLEDGSGERVFVGADGRVRILHGTNVVVKGPPWLPKRDEYDPLISLVDRDFELMRQAGINLIRLGVMWAGAEPERGQYNETYFQEIRGIVEQAASYGMYVLLDMHQDGLSERFCGEGIPPWAVKDPDHSSLAYPVPLWPLPAGTGEDGFPSRTTCSQVMKDNPFMHGWVSGHATYAAGFAFDALYTDRDLTDAWGAFWAKTATAVKGLSNVLGFELINEPFAGNPWADPLLMIPGRADEERLQPAYDRLVQHIRKVENETLIFFAGVTWDNAYPAGFRHAPGGDSEASRSVLAFHYYTPPQRAGHLKDYVRAMYDSAQRLGTGAMLTETCCGQLFDEVIPQLGEWGGSWVQWEWKDWCREDNESAHWDFQRAKWGACKTGYGGLPFNDTTGKGLEAIGQPYAPVVAGSIDRTSWSARDGVFELRFHPDRNATAPTEIFVNANLTFPTGFDIQVEPPLALDVESRPADFRVLLTPRPGAGPKDGLVAVRLRRRSSPAATLLV